MLSKALEVMQLYTGTPNNKLDLLLALVLTEQQRVFAKFYVTPFENV